MSARPLPRLEASLGVFLADCGATLATDKVAENRFHAVTTSQLHAVSAQSVETQERNAKQIAEMVGMMLAPPEALDTASGPYVGTFNYNNIDPKDFTVFDGRKTVRFKGKYTVGGAEMHVGRAIASRVKALIEYAWTQNINLKINEAERTYDTQLLYWKRYQNTLAARAGRTRPYPGLGDGPIAARPETGNHRKGLAVDFNLLGNGSNWQKTYQWLHKNAPRFGLYNTFEQRGLFDAPHWSANGS